MQKRSFVYLLILSALVIASCSDNSDDTTPNPSPVPVPTSISDPVFMATSVSPEIDAGISEQLPDFTPFVVSKYDRTGAYDPSTHLPVYDWIAVNARTTLVDNGSTIYLGRMGEIATEPPRLKHTRYWRKVFSVVLGENTSYSEARSVTYGISETDGRELSITVGMEASMWFATLKTEVSAAFSYEITHSTETSTEKNFTAQGAEGKDTVFTVWQRVNRFYLCDSAGTTLYDDKDVLCDRLQLRDDNYYFEEASESEYYLSTVMFDK